MHVCTITNDDIGAPIIIPPVPPNIHVVKVPNPLNLPTGPGLVTYTFTLGNLGTVPVTDITMVDDSCSPLALVTGDTNSDAQLDVAETWIYTCSMVVAATHANTAVVTGQVNGLSATDIAFATVVVTIPPPIPPTPPVPPTIPPLIHVTKIPNPQTLSDGGGLVTYTEQVTNPGTAPLTDVTITDDKCAPLHMTTGDTNGDLQLDPTETWTYTCQSYLTSTTTSTARAAGNANGLTATDMAIITVTTASPIPTFPNTGISTDDTHNASWCLGDRPRITTQKPQLCLSSSLD